jgi:hypothetical protein
MDSKLITAAKVTVPSSRSEQKYYWIGSDLG